MRNEKKRNYDSDKYDEGDDGMEMDKMEMMEIKSVACLLYSIYSLHYHDILVDFTINNFLLLSSLRF